MTEDPLLTICVTTYNSEKTIKKTLESVLAQTYPNFEILVSDNGSSDNTEKIVESFKKEHANITVRKNIPNIKPGKFYDGCYDNCNGCLRSGLIKGEFISFWHSDDIYQKTIATEQVEFLIDNLEVGAVFTLGNIIDSGDKIVGKFRLPKELHKKNTYHFTEIFKAILRYGNTFLITPTFMARTEIFKKVWLFHDEGLFGTSGDLEMWLRILETYPIGILQKNLICYRTGGGGKQHNRVSTEQAGFFKVMDYYLIEKSYLDKMDKISLRQYEYQKYFDNTLRAMNFLIKGQESEAKNIINHSFSFKIFRAFFENMNILRAKVLALKIILFIGINLGLGKYLGKILYRFS
ncbi:MAG: glycosyltransferase [Candidatus Staskawiczbacteria bacterium]|nr:glycosyltransferase [Candidatus Staskawiczbacteria bacterium]MBI3337226.1 glycosyltransferase [Candidatus Staskawiczbacteria bacterium]